jgi:hypothetical protein
VGCAVVTALWLCHGVAHHLHICGLLMCDCGVCESVVRWASQPHTEVTGSFECQTMHHPPAPGRHSMFHMQQKCGKRLCVNLCRYLMVRSALPFYAMCTHPNSAPARPMMPPLGPVATPLPLPLKDISAAGGAVPPFGQISAVAVDPTDRTVWLLVRYGRLLLFCECPDIHVRRLVLFPAGGLFLPSLSVSLLYSILHYKTFVQASAVAPRNANSLHAARKLLR